MVDISPISRRRNHSPCGGATATAASLRRRQRRHHGIFHYDTPAVFGIICGVVALLLLVVLAILTVYYSGWWYYPSSSSSSSSSRSNHNRHPQMLLRASSSSLSSSQFDVIVVGSGLAGLTTTLQVLDRGGRVALVEKEATLGGNSLKASSGINACCHDNNSGDEDTLQAFEQDTTKSAGTLARPRLIQELVESSASVLDWLTQRVGVDLSHVAQLGGHSHARTHRPKEGMVGAELMVHLEQLIRTYEQDATSNEVGEGHVSIYTQHPVTQLLQHNNMISGVQVTSSQTNASTILTAPQVVLATGGFASDRRVKSLLHQVRPDLVDFGTTGGSFSTGDGIALATSLGADTVDMEQIQLHPTGFVDTAKDPNDPTKVLAAELLRGVGGILLSKETGKRFCNELGTRDYVTQQMLKHAKDTDSEPHFALVLTEEAAQQASKHVELYHRKGLLTQVQGVPALAEWMSVVSPESLMQTFQDYQSDMVKGQDPFGKTVFPGFPVDNNVNWDQQVFFVGTVTPVLHYCMGGLSIDVEGHVLNQKGDRIHGLFAAGEVAGGVHGKNRLGGNSLLECAVFGRKIGQQLVLKNGGHNANNILPGHQPQSALSQESTVETIISLEELRRHASPHEDLWMALHGWVYNVTDFAGQHPGGTAILESLAGTDATEAFATVHSQQLLLPLQAAIVGKLDSATVLAAKPPTDAIVTHEELKRHATKDDCWVVFHGGVYDMTEFSKIHKGGAYLIQKYAGKDATDTYKGFHRRDKLALVAQYRVGTWEGEDATEV